MRRRARVSTSKTDRVAARAFVTSARVPSGVIATRMGNPAEGRLARTSRLSASMTLTVSSPRFVTQTSRPGCYLNIIPADGLVLIPESSSGSVKHEKERLR